MSSPCPCPNFFKNGVLKCLCRVHVLCPCLCFLAYMLPKVSTNWKDGWLHRQDFVHCRPTCCQRCLQIKKMDDCMDKTSRIVGIREQFMVALYNSVRALFIGLIVYWYGLLLLTGLYHLLQASALPYASGIWSVSSCMYSIWFVLSIQGFHRLVKVCIRQ